MTSSIAKEYFSVHKNDWKWEGNTQFWIMQNLLQIEAFKYIIQPHSIVIYPKLKLYNSCNQ